MDLISLLATIIFVVIYLIIGLNCGDLCKQLNKKATGKEEGGVYIFGFFFTFGAVVYYIGKYIAEKKD